MAEELEPTNQVDEEPQGKEDTTDWKAEARKWEKLAKKGHAAEIELEKMKSEQMTELEKATARAETAEKELASMKASAAKVDAARKLASETGVPFDMLMFCEDEEAMSEFAKTYAKETHVPAAPKAKGGSRIVKGEDSKSKDPKQAFAEFAAENLKF